MTQTYVKVTMSPGCGKRWNHRSCDNKIWRIYKTNDLPVFISKKSLIQAGKSKYQNFVFTPTNPPPLLNGSWFFHFYIQILWNAAASGDCFESFESVSLIHRHHTLYIQCDWISIFIQNIIEYSAQVLSCI